MTTMMNKFVYQHHQRQLRLFVVPHCLFLLLVSVLLLSADNNNTAYGSWVDPDTHVEHKTTKAFTVDDTRPYELVFSDEFEQHGRRFDDGKDPRWSAINKNDYTNAALHFYSHDNAVTTNGVLNITTDQKVNSYRAFDEDKKEYYSDKKYIQSGMLQSWNKFCFTGGIIEFRAKLPGHPEKGGLWPALWMLGNLARATYVGSSDFVWPYSYNKCDSRNRKSQAINACSRVNHFGMQPFTGRGSPEIDVLEAMQGDSGKLPNTFIHRPYQSTSLQVAPGVEIDRPVLGHRPHKGHWYRDLEYSKKNISDLNPYFYGVTLVHKPKSLTYQSDAISSNFQLNASHYNSFHKYRVEWEPPDESGSGGYIRWYTDEEFLFGIKGDSLDIMGTDIPSEPMYLLMNTAVSHTWGFPMPCPDNCDCDCYECGNPSCACALPSGYCENYPAHFEIDYVRVYQAVKEKKHILGCSPENRPTEQFIKGHKDRFMASGQKEPLLSVRKGGGLCSTHSECGVSDKMGVCSSSGSCVCYQNYTGPHCLAHAGFYDVDTRKKVTKFSLSEMMLPRSMIVLVALLAVGFSLSMCGTIRAKKKQPKYLRVGDVPTGGQNGSQAVQSTTEPRITSYQDSAAVHYALPTQEKKDVTYYVIDGRLVDDR